MKDDVEVRKYRVEYAPVEDTDELVIISRHTHSVEYLRTLPQYENAEVYSHFVEADELEGKHVIGALPPHLIKHCDKFTGVTLKGYAGREMEEAPVKELPHLLSIADTIRLKEIKA